MATTFIKDAVKVFIARENTTNDAFSGNYTHLDPSDSAIAHVLADEAVIEFGASTTDLLLKEITNVTGVSLSGFGKEFDTYQTVGDDFDHDIEIKDTGGGSCDFIVKSDTDGTAFDHLQLAALAYYYPNGWNTINSSPANTASFDPSIDTAVTRDTDQTGYAIIVQQQIASDSFIFWCFDNCKISCSISFASRQASRGTLTWENARYVSFDSFNSAILTTSDHNDDYPKGWHSASAGAK